jgi:hypothetical protein
MDQEKVKEQLLRLYGGKADFTVIFSGRKNGKVNGVYKPGSREIVIHDRNFTVDDTLMYTAIHELAHHVMDADYGFRGTRSHTQRFWAVFHELLDKARREGIYTVRPDRETGELLEEARRVSREIAELERRLGRILIEIEERCETRGLRAEGFIEGEAQISRKTYRAAAAAAYLDLPPEFGADIQEAVLRERDPDARRAALAAAREGKSAALVRQAGKGPPEPSGGAAALYAEKARLERTVKSLTRRLLELELRLAETGAGGGGAPAREAGGQPAARPGDLLINGREL